MSTRRRRRHRAFVIAKRIWLSLNAFARAFQPLGQFRKNNLSCNCFLCSEGDELQRFKLERRSPLPLED